MSSQHHPSDAASGIGALPEHTDDSVADTLIGAVRACSPDYPPSIEYVRTALIDYVDTARARGEAQERTTAAVRFMVTTILTSAVWSGANRAEARELIRSLMTLCAERYATEPARRD
jgi:hypothetical protein